MQYIPFRAHWALICVLLVAAVAAASDWPLVVHNEHGGSWQGVLEDDVVAYYGIRYVLDQLTNCRPPNFRISNYWPYSVAGFWPLFR